MYSAEDKSHLQFGNLDSCIGNVILYIFRTTLPNSSCHIKAPELPPDLQGISWVLLTPEVARGGQLDRQEPPLQDPMDAALRERAGRLRPREHRVINFIQQQLQAWERQTFSTGTAFKTEVTLTPQEQSWEILR